MKLRLGRLTGLPIGIAAGLLALAASSTRVVERLELGTVDARIAYRGDLPLDPRVVVIDIDDEAVDLLGYPIARGHFAALLDVVHKSGARAVGFDVLFIGESAPEQDALLVRAAAACKCAVFPSQLTFAADRTTITAVHRPFAALDAVSAAQAHVQLDNAADGVFRRVFMETEHEGSRWMPLGLAVASVGGAPATSDRPPAGGFAHLGWRSGRSQDIKSVTFLDVLAAAEAEKAGEKPPVDLKALFAGALVLVGPSAKDIGDRGAVPSSPDAPLVLVHATFLDNLMNDRLMPPPPLSITAIFTLLAALLVALAVSLLPALLGALAAVVVVGAVLVNAQLAFGNAGLWLPVAAPLIGAGIAFIGASVANVALRDAGERRMKRLFSRYVAPHILEQILKNPDSVDIRGHKRRITLLFSDIKGYTTLSNALPADEIVELLCAYLDTMVGILLEHSGTVDKIMGDGIMCFFGDPVAYDDHALRAVKAALAMQRAVDGISDKLGDKWRARKLEPLQVRIGIATGEVFVGTIGSREHLEYTAIGRPVNLAARLEGKAPPGGILISRETYEAVKAEVVVREVQGLDLKGYSTGYDAFQVLGLAGDAVVTTAADQRAGTRRPWIADVKLSVAGVAFDVRSTDISPGGMFVVCDTVPPEGTSVVLEANIGQGGAVRIDAVVTHVREGKSGARGCGLMFRSVFADDRRAISALLAGVLGEDGFDEQQILADERKGNAGGFTYRIDADRGAAVDDGTRGGA